MKAGKIVVMLVVFLITNLYSQVTIQKVIIDAEFCSVLNKTRVQFFLYNSTERDSLNKVINLHINKSSIITDMWLEINGKLKQAETLSSTTGERIYNRVTWKRIDPALMMKNNNGDYTIRVFPINHKKYRRVVIEYCSILESEDDGKPQWVFGTGEATKMYFDISGTMPPNTIASVQNENFELSRKEKSFVFDTTNKVDFQFLFSNQESNIRLFNNSAELLQIKETKNFKTLMVSYNTSIPDFLFTSVNDIHNGKVLNIINKNSDPFLESFLKFLSAKKYISVMNNLDAWNWYLDTGNWQYRDNNFLLLFNDLNKAEQPTLNIRCPFVDVFTRYVNNVDKDIKTQKGTGLLYSGLSKLVLENDKRALSIRDEELQYEKEREESYSKIDKSSPLLDDDDSDADLFIAYDQAPEPIGGFATIQDRLVYPRYLREQGIEGRVFINCKIDEDGDVIRTKVLNSLHPVLDMCAVKAVRQTPWKPAYQRERAISVWIAIPVIFKIKSMEDKFGIDKYLGKTLYDKVIDKYFDIRFNEQTIQYIEVGFDSTHAQKLEYGSNELFQLLFDEPALIKYVYQILDYVGANELGIIVNGKSLLINSNINKIDYNDLNPDSSDDELGL